MDSYAKTPNEPSEKGAGFPNFVLSSPNFVLSFPNFVLSSPNFVLSFPYFGLSFPYFGLSFPYFRQSYTAVSGYHSGSYQLTNNQNNGQVTILNSNFLILKNNGTN